MSSTSAAAEMELAGAVMIFLLVNIPCKTKRPQELSNAGHRRGDFGTRN